MVSGKLLLTDSTHILANAAKEKREIIEVPDTPSEYVKKLDREALEAGLLEEPVTYPDKTRTVTKSTTDPESGLMNRPGKPNAFCYLNHQTSDAESGIITDVFVTPGNVNDCTPHTSRLETQIDKFGFETEAVCADAGYDNSEVYDAMLKRGIRTYIPKKRKPNNTPSYAEGFEPEAFTYDPEADVYLCPQGKILAYSCYNKNGHKKRYLAARKECNNCPCRQQCVGSSKNSRMVERMLHEEARQEQAKSRNTPEYFAALRLRKIWCEGNFSHQKAEHNLRRTYKRGIERVTEQCLLSACAMNLIRLVKAANAVFFRCLGVIFQGLFHLGVFVNSTVSLHPQLCRASRSSAKSRASTETVSTSTSIPASMNSIIVRLSSSCSAIESIEIMNSRSSQISISLLTNSTAVSVMDSIVTILLKILIKSILNC